jgi:hypothetical protein
MLLVLLAGTARAGPKQEPSRTGPQLPTQAALNPDRASGESLGGSFVSFNPSVGGDPCYFPEEAHTFCFEVHSFTNDWEHVQQEWLGLPAAWTITNAYVLDTPAPACTSGGTWGEFAYTLVGPNEVNLQQARFQSESDECVAYYCIDVVAQAGGSNEPASWYWDGDGYGFAPHHPCSADGYTPTGQPACDEMLHPAASILACAMSPLMLTPPTRRAQGCSCWPQQYSLTAWNNTGQDTSINFSYTDPCVGPASLSLPNGGNAPISVTFTPQGNPGDVAQCSVTAQDVQNPNNQATATIDEALISRYWDAAGWQPETVAGAVARYWQQCTPGTYPTAGGAVGYQVGGLDASGQLLASLQAFDPAVQTWTQLGPPPVPVFGGVASFIDGKLYLSGGFDSTDFTGSTALQIYDPASNTWTLGPPVPAASGRGGAGGGKGPCRSNPERECHYQVGGGPNGQFADLTLETWQYDPVASSWTQMRDVPVGSRDTGLLSAAGVGCLGKIYVGGDFRGTADLASYDPATDRWAALANIPAQAGKMSPALVCDEAGNALYLIGGDQNGWWGTYNTSVWRYDIPSNTWSQLSYALATGVLGSCGYALDDQLWILGGAQGNYAVDPPPHESLQQITCAPCEPSYKLLMPLIIHNENHALLEGALVHGTWTLPDGSTRDNAATTNADGQARFVLKSPACGRYRFDVTDVTKAGYLYAPGANEQGPHTEWVVPCGKHFGLAGAVVDLAGRCRSMGESRKGTKAARDYGRDGAAMTMIR